MATHGGHARYSRASSLIMLAGVPSGPRNPEFSLSAQIDWTTYERVHSNRRNLVIHAFAVPLFIASIVFLIASIVRTEDVSVVIAVILAFIAMGLQRRGHALEPHAPVPFSGPGNFLTRWFTEQFIIFPLFLLTGRWWHQFKSEAGESDDAA